jgi:hypothetical protein
VTDDPAGPVDRDHSPRQHPDVRRWKYDVAPGIAGINVARRIHRHDPPAAALKDDLLRVVLFALQQRLAHTIGSLNVEVSGESTSSQETSPQARPIFSQLI